MSLNWNIQDIKDCENVCFEVAEETDKVKGVVKGDKTLKPLTEALIWATITVDMRGITEKNWKEFAARLMITEKLDGPWLRKVKDGEIIDQFITWEDVKAHIGLSVNVQELRRHIWANRFVDKVADGIIKTIDLLSTAPESDSDASKGESRPSTPEEGATP